MAPPGGRHGGYNDIPENDDMDGDDYSADGENPFAATTSARSGSSNGRRTGSRKTAAIRAGGALDDGRADDHGAYDDDDVDLDDLDDFEEQASSSSRRRNHRSGHRRMDVQTLGSLQGRGGNDMRGNMTKCWLYCGLAMLAVMGVLLGILKESRIEKHMAAGVGVEGYARPQDSNDDDDGRHWHDEQDAEEQQQEGEVTSTNAASPSQAAASRPASGGAGAGPMKPAKKEPHHRDPAATFRSHDPFHLTDTPWYGSVFAPPPFPAYANAHAADDGDGEEEDSFSAGIGYFQSPSIHNDTLLFVSEGDLYLTQIPPSTFADNKDDGPLVPLPSVKLTTTVGNVLTPHINPVHPYLVAYTGTYTGTREAYLLDLRPSSARGFGPAGPAMRLTYFDGVYGVEHIVGWDDDGTSLVVATMHDEIGIENMRLYKIGIVQNGKETKKRRRLSSHHQGSPITVSSVDAIPLHQAIDGVTAKSADGESKCIFFTRFKQSSSTFRYVGGTAEHLWAWCEGEDRAVALTADYRGTSKSPGIYHVGSGGDGGDSDAASYLLYISDRFEAEDGTWIPGTLNLWAVPLPSQDELYSDANSGADAKANHIPKKLRRPFPLTSVNCDYNGMSLMEYSIDEVTGNIILRIGADLLLVERKEVVDLLERGGKRRRLDDDDEVDDDEKEEEKSVEAESAVKKDTKKKKKKNKAKEGEDSSAASPSAAIQKADKAKSVSSHLGAKRLPIFIMSDLQNLQERLLPITHPTYAKLVNGIDAYKTPYGTMSALITIRGQAWINPVIPDLESFYEFEGGAMNLPPRRYRVVPGSTTGGVTRVMQALHVPQPEKFSRTSLIVATDPLSPTAELAFYLIETLADSTPAFSEINDLPRPILGGHVNGGSVKDGGLGSIKDDGVVVSPCGRRVAWTDTDGRICAMALPDLGAYWSANATEFEAADPLSYTVLPQENENGEPLLGINAELTWSSGGRYLAIEHAARNQFSIISIADLGEIGEKEKKTASSSNDAPQSTDEESKNNGDWNINLGRIVQATPDRFNSGDVFWGRTAFDMAIEDALGVPGSSKILPTATTLYYLTDRDVMLSDVSSPWGTRAPSPHFKKDKCVYALPLVTDEDEGEGGEDDEDDDVNVIKKMFGGPYSGGGASELAMLRETVLEESEAAKEEAEEAEEEEEGQDTTMSNLLSGDNSTAATNGTLSEGDSAVARVSSLYPADVDIFFGPKEDASLSFARRAYRMSNIPKASYFTIISQLKDDAALILMEDGENGPIVKVFSIDDFPSDGVDPMPVDIPGMEVISAGLSTSRHLLYFIYKLPGKYRTKIIGNDAGSVVSMLIKDDSFTKNIVDNVQWALSIWPSLEYQQMYADAWRLLRDYYYDAGMTDINWKEVYERYLPLVGRAVKREELDDVLRQMASELSALHVFVYGGEYNSPLHEDVSLEMANEVSSLGATLRRSVEWAGYVVTSIPERDQDFALMDGKAIYSPLSEDTLRMSGQHGLEVGDVIVGVNGESVMNVPSIHMLLRGMAGKSVRLEVLRVKSAPSPLLTRKRKRQLDAASGVSEAKDKGNGDDEATPEPLIAVPLSPSDAAHLRYTAWEWSTRNAVKDLSRKAGFTAGYIHLRDMSGGKAADAFARGFYPDYDKQALIVDVRANHGGNIDSWLLDVLQRRAWMYWQGRATNITNGGLGWDEQFSFRGHVVVLINEKTSSDGEGFSRGISELGLGKLVGTRTWGGGIWLSSDNHLVDGGIATAPEIGTYNKNFGWGLGIENMGVEPDIWVDNDPHETYGGRDAQLEKAIEVLMDWLEEEPVVLPQSPGRHRDMSLRDEAKRCLVYSRGDEDVGVGTR